MPRMLPSLTCRSSSVRPALVLLLSCSRPHSAPIDGMAVVSGLTVRLGPVLLEGDALDATLMPPTGFAYDSVTYDGATYCEDVDGELVDDSLCGPSTPGDARYSASVKASVIIPNTHLTIGAGRRFDHSSKKWFASGGVAFPPSPGSEKLIVISLNGSANYVSLTVGLTFPLWTR